MTNQCLFYPQFTQLTLPLKSSASQMITLLCNLPFIVGRYIPEDEQNWMFLAVAKDCGHLSVSRVLVLLYVL